MMMMVMMMMVMMMMVVAFTCRVRVEGGTATQTSVGQPKRST